MAKRKSTPKPAVNETQSCTKEILEAAENQVVSVMDQLKGLQIFLKALGEASDSTVVDLNDLTFGFGNLLAATEASSEDALRAVVRARESLNPALAGEGRC